MCSGADQDRARAEGDHGAEGEPGVLDGAEVGRLVGRQGDAGEHVCTSAWRGSDIGRLAEAVGGEDGCRDGEAPERHGDGTDPGAASAPGDGGGGNGEQATPKRREGVRDHVVRLHDG